MSPTVVSLLLLCGIDGRPGGTVDEPIYERAPLLTEGVKHELDGIIENANQDARPLLSGPARSLTEARRLALHKDNRFDNGMTWAVEYRGWYFFSFETSDHQPMLWFHGVAVCKDSKEVYYFGGGW